MMTMMINDADDDDDNCKPHNHTLGAKFVTGVTSG